MMVELGKRRISREMESSAHIMDWTCTFGSQFTEDPTSGCLLD
jgi:hypothetical protein